jgi:hypothetical protein
MYEMRVRKAKPKLSRRQIKFASILGVLAVLVIIIFVVIKNMSAPAVGSLNQKPPEKTEIVDPYQEAGAYTGKYINFTYPAHYKQQKAAINGSTLEATIFVSTDHSNKQIAVSVEKGSLEDESGIKFRQVHPERYQEDKRTSNGKFFISTSGEAERTAFIQDGDKLITVSASGPSGVNVADDAQIVISSLKFK